MKQFAKIAILFAVFAFVAASCGKYEEGPSISLASKKGRLANVWKIESVYENGTQITLSTNQTDSYVEFTKDGKVIQTTVVMGQSVSNTGTWKFDDKKENVITEFNYSGIVYTETAKILKLKSSELWVEITDGSDKTEYHYVTK